MSGYHFVRMHVSNEAVHDCAVDMLALALEKLWARAMDEPLDNPQTVILPPIAHHKDSSERARDLWTVALTDNPSDFVRRIVGIGGYRLEEPKGGKKR